MQGTAAGNGQPAAQSKLRELRQRARSACFVPVVAINKPDFLAGYSLFYESARYRGDFLAAIENNRNFTLSRVRCHEFGSIGTMLRAANFGFIATEAENGTPSPQNRLC